MANIVPNSFKSGLLKGTFNFDTSGNGGNAFKCALYTSISSYSTASTVYLAGTGNGEVSSSGTSYTAGGNALTNNGIAGTTTAFVDFADLTFGTATVTARGCMIYNSSDSNKSVATIDFGGDKTSTAGDFTVVFPAAAASTAIIRIA